MRINMKDLNRLNPDFETSKSNIYILENGLYLKRFLHLDDTQKKNKYHKICLSGDYQNIEGLKCPVDIAETERGFCGYLQEKAPGIFFVDYINDCFTRGQSVSLDEIIHFIYSMEKIIKAGNEREMFFPDACSNNFLYDIDSKKVSAIDYDDNQIKDFSSDARSDLIYWKQSPIAQIKKYENGDVIDKNMDIYSISALFFYYTTGFSFKKNNICKDNIKEMLQVAHLPQGSLYDKFITLYDFIKENEYIGDDLLELNKQYVLTPKKRGQPREFVLK